MILAVLVGAGYWGVTTGIGKVKDQFSSADDYPGPGRADVTFEVKQGDSIAEMGRGLKSADIVASVEAFIDAAEGNAAVEHDPGGLYPLKKQMKASDVVNILVDPGNIVDHVSGHPRGVHGRPDRGPAGQGDGIQEGAEFEAALKDPQALGLPADAKGNAGGLPVPGDLLLRPGREAGRHAP